MAKALANKTGLNFIPISAPILFSKWLGESEKALHEIFKKAKQSAPCILFFDEIDALVARRGAGSEVGAPERVASQFFNELDTLSDLSEVIILGATNREDLLDPALRRAGRLDFVLPFPVPDEAARLEILKIHTKDRPLSAEVDLKELAKETAGLAGSDLAYICKRAVILAIGDVVSLPGESRRTGLSVSVGHFRAAISEVQRTRKP